MPESTTRRGHAPPSHFPRAHPDCVPTELQRPGQRSGSGSDSVLQHMLQDVRSKPPGNPPMPGDL